MRSKLADQSIETPSPGLGESMILVVADDVAMTRALEGFLLRRGLAVVTATTTRDALTTAAAYEPDIILCDWHLGGDDGAELIRQMRPVDEGGPRCILMAGAEADERLPDLGVPWLVRGPRFIPELRTLLDIPEI
jgi:CheY-like chemotaxis protein